MAALVSESAIGNDIGNLQNGPKRIRVKRMKSAFITTGATTDDTDTVAVTLADIGMSSFQAMIGVTHSTANSIVITEAPTTAVASGILTITVGGSTDNKIRGFWIVGTEA